jgi:hypothetical protein
MRSRVIALAVLVASVAVCADAQAVISTRSGVVHYFEGAVYLSGQPLETRLGKFASMPDGAELRTEKGRAEVLLTPGVVLRLDQNSAIRMLSNSLEDTRVEMLEGSAIIDAGESVPDAKLTVLEKGRGITFSQAGIYRLDSAPPRLMVREGEALVAAGPAGGAVTVEGGSSLALNETAANVSAPSAEETRDSLDNWSRGREDSISADNAIAASIQDPGTQDSSGLADPALVAAGLVYPPQPGFTQFPMLGLSPVSPLYSSLYPYQPGFYSSYLPGYTYRPLFLLVSPVAIRNTLGRNPTVYAPYSSIRTGTGLVAPRVGSTISTPYSNPSYSVRPVGPAVRPTTPAVRAPAVAPHAGGRR